VTAVSVIVGDLTALDELGVHAAGIVNAANRQLLAGGGVCGAIFAAAGRAELAAACAEIGGCAEGDATTTPSFALGSHGVRVIIHAVGPVWDEHHAARCDAALASAYRAILREAVRSGISSVAIPAISTGVYGFPAPRAARIAVEEVVADTPGLEEVYLVAFDEAGGDLLTTALAEQREGSR
jgi:O-acetyl-ADP-ribose deacetylase (regulator of RNase III)